MLTIQIIQYIHLLALNPNLALVSKLVNHSLSSLPASYAARYLLAVNEPYGPHEILNRSVRYPICSVGVAKEIKRIWDKRRGYVAPVIKTNSTKTNSANDNDGDTNGDDDGDYDRDDDDPSGPSTPTTTAPALTCSELPRRLFRPPKNDHEPIHPLVRYLFQAYSPSANSHKGYPLCRAVLTANYDLISFLLAHRADPGIKDHLPVQVAISIKDVRAVRMLVERTEDERKEPVDDEAGRKQGRERRRVKRRRLSDRVTITPALVECALKKGSKDIVEYFVQEKGASEIGTALTSGRV